MCVLFVCCCRQLSIHVLRRSAPTRRSSVLRAACRAVYHRRAGAVGIGLGFAAHRLGLTAAVEAADEETIASAVLRLPRRQAPAEADREAVLVEQGDRKSVV